MNRWPTFFSVMAGRVAIAVMLGGAILAPGFAIIENMGKVTASAHQEGVSQHSGIGLRERTLLNPPPSSRTR